MTYPYIKGADFFAYNIKLIKEQREKDRKEFLNLLLDDDVVKNNRVLQDKYMELYDKYTSDSYII